MQQRGKIISVSNVKIDVKTCFLRAFTILLTLLVIALVSACSSETHQLCNIRINLEEENSRSLSAEPLKNYTIYYKSIYRGSSPSKAYGDMSDSSYFKKLTTNGILVSQGLWEIQAIFKVTDQGDTYTPTNEDLDLDLIATSGNIYINLNTKSIAVRFSSNKGYVYFSSYELRSIPSSVSNQTISVSVYKYDETVSAFSSTATTIPVEAVNSGNTFSATESVQLDTGIYYAVVSVKGTVSNTSKTLFTDCIGFVVRSGLTTDINGYCDKYDSSTSGGGIVVVKPEETTTSKVSDIKDFKENDFIDNTTYQLPSNYEMIPSKKSDAPYEKIISSNKTITIDLNGSNLTNAAANNGNSVKSLFVVESNSTLNIQNTKSGTNAWIGTKKLWTSRFQTSFRVNGGTLNVGQDKSVGNIIFKGCPASITPPTINGIKESRHAPIDITINGGTVNLEGKSGSNITIEESVKGIATIENDKTIETTDKFKVKINLKYASIKTQGSTDIPNYGIYLDGRGKDGSIQIDIENLAANKSIYTKGSSAKGYGIYITDFKGPITINIKDNEALIQSDDGYGIYIADSCTGEIKIDNKGTISGSVAALYLRGEIHETAEKKKYELKEVTTQSNTN